MTTTCPRCGEVNPAEVHTCMPKRSLIEQEVVNQHGKGDAYYDDNLTPAMYFARGMHRAFELAAERLESLAESEIEPTFKWAAGHVRKMGEE